jgi:hypothetical protein
MTSCTADRHGDMLIDQIQFPASNDIDTRLAWAGERAWDIAEGIISRDVAAVILTTVIGWSDLGTESERASCRAMARQIDSMLQAA